MNGILFLYLMVYSSIQKTENYRNCHFLIDCSMEQVYLGYYSSFEPEIFYVSSLVLLEGSVS